MSEPPLNRLRRMLNDRHEEFGSWAKAAEGCGFDGEYLRQIAVGDKDPPDRTVKTLLRWLQPQRQLPQGVRRALQQAEGDREKLAQWLEWLSTILRHDLLPGLVWNEGQAGRHQGQVGRPPPAPEDAERLAGEDERSGEGA